jgi:hypothetical protein
MTYGAVDGTVRLCPRDPPRARPAAVRPPAGPPSMRRSIDPQSPPETARTNRVRSPTMVRAGRGTPRGRRGRRPSRLVKVPAEVRDLPAAGVLWEPVPGDRTREETTTTAAGPDGAAPTTGAGLHDTGSGPARTMKRHVSWSGRDAGLETICFRVRFHGAGFPSRQRCSLRGGDLVRRATPVLRTYRPPTPVQGSKGSSVKGSTWPHETR